jgi:hypothetical protein
LELRQTLYRRRQPIFKGLDCASPLIQIVSSGTLAGEQGTLIQYAIGDFLPALNLTHSNASMVVTVCQAKNAISFSAQNGNFDSIHRMNSGK